MKNKFIYGGILGTIGFLLSPISWWNDLFINFPIAYFFACAVNLIYKGAFLWAFIISYWITNVLGFILLQKGMENAFKDEGEKRKYSRKNAATFATIFKRIQQVKKRGPIWQD